MSEQREASEQPFEPSRTSKTSTLSSCRVPPDALGLPEHGISPSIHVTYQDPATGRIRGKRLPMISSRGAGDD